jgi:uncharacterized protein (TIGR03086 family)
MVLSDDIRELDRRAVLRSMDIVRSVLPADLDRSTPCSAWTLRDLLGHMTVQHRGFAAASQGQAGDLALWRPDDRDPDPAGSYLLAAGAVIEAFGVDGVLERPFLLPEISTAVEVPGSTAVGFHFIDYVVHGWDVARALSQDYVLDEDLAGPALRIALAVPDGPARLDSSASFKPGLAEDPTSSPLAQILRALGRSPDWTNEKF